MKKSLLEHLRCSATGDRLSLKDVTEEDATDIITGRLVTKTGREYAIAGGVPVMLIPEDWPQGQAETRQSFSTKWKLAPNYRKATLNHYINWYLERYGFNTIDRLGNFLKGKRKILDAGTGHGRDAELFAKNGQAEVFGIDISDGIYNAYRDLHSLPNLNLIQADLTRLPFPAQFFDFISCDQVIHHTPNTHESFLSLLKHLAPGGHIGIYVYKKKGPMREFADDYVRERTVKMSAEECMKFSEAMTSLGKALADLKAQIDIPQDIPLLGIKAGKHDVQRFLYWNFLKCYWNETIDWDSNVITNFDWYHPLHAHRHTPDEVRGWFEEAGLEVCHFDIVESGISVIGRKS